jgi:hypothetical protein
MVAGAVTAVLLVLLVVVALGSGREPVVGVGPGTLAAFGAVTVVLSGSVPAAAVLRWALAGGSDRPVEHPASSEAKTIDRSHRRIRGRLPRSRVASVVGGGSLIP